MYAYVQTSASAEAQEEIQRQAAVNRTIRLEKEEAQRQKRKRKTNEAREAKRLSAVRERAHVAHDWTQFLDVPTVEQVNRCHQAFYAATNNSAVRLATCAVCARERSERDAGFTYYPLSTIPNSHRLRPSMPHAGHDLVQGMLLERAGFFTGPDSDNVTVRICGDCDQDLLASEDVRPPPLSLANGLWVGPIPWELAVLTLPEQLLLAQVYPRVFVFKLHPANLHHAFPADNCQRAMRGNVSTYALDSAGIHAMLKGQMMPRPPSILASVIAVTFFGRGKLPRHKLRGLFRVRRDAVLRALLWHKAHNPYYANIDIDYDVLNSLPDDDVPDEIMAIVRQSDDVEAVEREREGYNGNDDADDDTATPSTDDVTPDVHAHDDAEINGNLETMGVSKHGRHVDATAVIPLHISGAVDTDLLTLSTVELETHAVSNLWDEGDGWGYLIKHGSRPLNDFGRDRTGRVNDEGNIFERAYPVLYPYGTGGIEGNQTTPVDFSKHVRWSLEYHDRRFRKHETFPFMAFGILQRRQALGTARIQMRRRDFDKHARLFSSLNADQLKNATQQETRGEPVSDPVVRLLRKHLFAGVGRVSGSNQSRYQLRSQIWSTTIRKGPPSLWITINPSDINDPIAQVFAGEEIDLDNFIATQGPDKEQRTRNIASDPYAAAKFFHFTINAVLEHLLQIQVTPYRVKSEMGVLGRIAAYFGTVESQGRGTLHLHLLLWATSTPSAEQIQSLFLSDAFRDKLRQYIRANIRAYLPGLETVESIKAIPRNPEASFSRPPRPGTTTYEADVRSAELELARMEQVHTCKLGRCLKFDRSHRMVCKRRAPFPLSDDDVVFENGEWMCKRLCPYVNAWNPSILLNARCNNDIKLLTNGSGTRSISFYVTAYAAKKQGKSYNLSAITEKTFAYHQRRNAEDGRVSVQDTHRLLLYRLMHAVNREQELAAPMVVSYLMGWGDTYCSHRYAPIYWGSFARVLRTRFQELASKSTNRAVGGSLNGVGAEGTGAQSTDDTGNDVVVLDKTPSGDVVPQCQYVDYTHRGEVWEDMNVLDFFTDTYEADMGKAKQTCSNDGVRRSTGTKGRPRHDRVKYFPQHPRSQIVWRIRRGMGHNTLPNILGPYFTCNDDPATYPFYCASMLLLLKPWRSPDTDLKEPTETWEAAFDCFLRRASPDIRATVSNIQYFHSCESASQHAEHRVAVSPQVVSLDGELDADDDDAHGEEFHPPPQEGRAPSLAQLRLALYGRLAVETAWKAGIFPSDRTTWSLVSRDCERATRHDLSRLTEWRTQMQRDVEDRNANGNAFKIGPGPSSSSPPMVCPIPHAIESAEAQSSVRNLHGAWTVAENPIDALHPSALNEAQRRSVDIIRQHLQLTMSGAPVQPLRMIVHGEGGTGKTTVIQTVTDLFQALNVSHLLLKAAFTGIAASLISGKTTHFIGQLSVRKKTDPEGEERKKKLRHIWRDATYLIIDEYSMLSKSLLARLSEAVSTGVDGSGKGSFGGVNVILFGDLHQFPPVGKGIREALFEPTDPGDHTFQKLGRSIYEEFKTVVLLTEQRRITDPVWHDFLQHLRYGKVQAHHLDMLKKQVIGHPNVANTDYNDKDWKKAPLITPRHVVRTEWNEAATRKWCCISGERLYVCTAFDTVGGKPLTEVQQRARALRTGDAAIRTGDVASKKEELPTTLELAKGMSIMVTTNVETDLDVTKGEIVDIVLHPDEPPLDDDPVVRLTHLPVYILVKLVRTRATQLSGLDDCVIPVEPRASRFLITYVNEAGISVRKTVKRLQYPITAAYAFTDYRAQGQTIPHVIIDIGKLPAGTLTLFNLYVALSRSPGRQTIRLLRDFDESMFKKGHTPSLLAEDDRLQRLNDATKDKHDGA